MSANDIKFSIIDTGRRLYDRSLVTASEGNLSIRTKSDRIYISATGTCLGRLKKSDVTAIDLGGKPLSISAKPSTEFRLHLAVYKNRPEIMACCHAHPPYATAFGLINREFPRPFLPEAALFVGQVIMVDYATPGTEKLARNLEKCLNGHSAFILKNHGVLTLGRSMEEAFNRMEMVENLARIAYIGSALGKIKPLERDEIRRLEKIGKSFSSDRSADD